MGLRKILASVLLLGGFGLLGTGIVVGLDGPLSPAAPDAPKSAARPAPPQVDTARAEAAWRDWMAAQGVTSSSLAIGQGGTILHSAGEKRSSQTNYPMASLSKPVTGICLNQLLEGSPYGWHSTLADLAPEFAKVNFTPAAEQTDLTLTQIATHTSGLPEELTYGQMSTRARNLSSQPTMARAALKEPANFGTRGSYVYSNANYAILGVLIEALSGQPYGSYCAQQVMAPAGATQAAVAGRMSHAAGYGGWQVSVEDYARFAMHWFAPDRAWMVAPQRFAYDERAQYGMGVHVFPARSGASVSHTGRWTHKDPHRPNIGALFFVRADGVAIVVNWDGSLDRGSYNALFETLHQAL